MGPADEKALSENFVIVASPAITEIKNKYDKLKVHFGKTDWIIEFR